MGAEFVLGVLALLVTQLFPRQLIGLFGAESALYNEFAVLTFRVYLCMLPLATVNKAAFIFMQALGRPVESAGLSFSGRSCWRCRSCCCCRGRSG